MKSKFNSWPLIVIESRTDKVIKINLFARNIGPVPEFYNSISPPVWTVAPIVLWRYPLSQLGVGGTGRSSSARLATFISGSSYHELNIRRNYTLFDLRDDLKAILLKCGSQKKMCTLFISELHILQVSVCNWQGWEKRCTFKITWKCKKKRCFLAFFAIFARS